MRLIISGSRTVTDKNRVFASLDAFCTRQMPTEVVCGMASGADLIGREWAIKKGIPVKDMPAEWNNLNALGAKPATRKDGTGMYNKTAGIMRNIAMGSYADYAICFWDGQSRGTKNMIEVMRNKFKKPVSVVYTDKSKPPRKLKGEQ